MRAAIYYQHNFYFSYELLHIEFAFYCKNCVFYYEKCWKSWLPTQYVVQIIKNHIKLKKNSCQKNAKSATGDDVLMDVDRNALLRKL